MPEQGKQIDPPATEGTGATAVAAPRAEKAPAKTPPAQLPTWKVLLHNDDKNEMLFVIQSIVELTPLSRQDAMNRMLEAHESGLALLLVTHKERAELYQEQFQSKSLTVTIEPDA